MKNVIPPVKGTRDYYPEEMALRTWLYAKMREVSESFGYQEYEAPLLETLELYAAKSGEELVKEQSFVFSDRGGEPVALRPELTPSLSRMVAQRQRQLVYPLRWWSFGPFWRYEQPQKGRTREFFQWNVDLLGVESPEADAELIALVASFFKRVGLSPSEVVIRVNNRQLTDSELTAIGVPQSIKTDVFNLIDRRKKMKLPAWEENARQIGVTETQLDAIQSMLDDDMLWKKSPELCRVFESLEAMGVADYVQYDPGIIRGLLYYTGTVFEAFDRIGYISRSILGGGRYDNLLSDVGGDPLPASGFAMGDLIITLLLQKLGHIPQSVSQPTAQVMVSVFSDETMMKSQALAAELREAGFNTTCYPTPDKLGKQFKFADRSGTQIVLILGPDEINESAVAVKNLSDGSQITIQREQLASHLANLIPSS